MSNINRFDAYKFTKDSLNLIDNLTEQQFIAQYPILAEMVSSVKRYSVLLTSKKRLEIYYAVIEYADPKIELFLAAARDNSGNQLFPTNTILRQFMFGTSTTDTISADVTFKEKDIFVDGIKRVSVALAAALLIGQLAQVPEQQKHSEYIEKQALADLARILQVPSIQDLQKKEEQAETALIKSFYFKAGVYDLPQTPTPISISMEVYLAPASSTWLTVNTYTSSINTATLIADLADTINSYTLTSMDSQSNLVAAPVLAGEDGLHRLDFSTRKRDLVVCTELLSVRFTPTYNDVELPFKWGVDTQNIASYYLNSLILTTQSGKVNSVSPSSTSADDIKLNVLYFRTIPNVVPTTNDIEYRISPTMDETRFITVESPVYDNDRANGAVTALLNDLYDDKSNNLVLGSIVQNTPNTTNSVYAGLHLVSYIINNSITEYILDIVSLPEDIELAVGNKLGPITSFSSKPRSITVPTYYEQAISDALSMLDKAEDKSLTVKSKPSKILQRMNDIRQAQYISHTIKQGYPMPPATANDYLYHPKNYL